MFLKYFTDPDSLKYNISDAYDEQLVSILLPIMHYTSIISVVFSALLIGVIIFKTPKAMKFFKFYLLPYVLNTLLLEIVMLWFKPLLLHPYFAVVSLEMTQTASPKMLIIMFIFMAYFAMSLIDCIVAMSAERYFALTDMSGKHARKPIYIFVFLSTLTLCFLVFSITLVCIDSVRDLFIMPSKDSAAYLESHLKNYSKVFSLNSILVFRTDISISNFTIGFTLFVTFVFSRYLLAGIFFILNALQSHGSTITMSRALKRHNTMLLRCTYAQFAGFCLLAGLPAMIIVLIYYFFSEPSKLVYLCFLLMNTFGLFDILITIACIKPYRQFFVDLVRLRCFRKVTPQTLYMQSVKSIM